MSENSALHVPAPDAELRRLAPLAGSWLVRGDTEEGIGGPAVPTISNEEFYWLEGGYFLVSTYHTIFGNDPPQQGINYWFQDAARGEFQIIFFSNNGPFTEEGNRHRGVISGRKLTFSGSARFTIELDDDGNVKVNPDRTITLTWELQNAAGAWQHWMVNTYARVADSKQYELE